MSRTIFSGVGLGLALALAGLISIQAAAAQNASGTISGRVLWGPCVRIPLPASPAAPGVPQPNTAPDASSGGQPSAPTVRGLPAGAVLVAVQNTAISARTDETGSFSLQGVPSGQYLTVAAGPVANSTSAVAERPNVFVSGGQSVEIGTLVLGGSSPLGIACRGIGPAATEGITPAPADQTTPPDTDQSP